MRLPTAFLKTKIARRVFGLFLLCAVLPTATLAGAGYWIVSRELHDQAREALSQAGKVWGVLLLARLQEADRSLVNLVEMLRRDAPAARSAAAPLGERFRSVGLGALGAAPRALLGVPGEVPPPATTRQALEHLSRERTLLVTVAAPGSPRIYLVRLLVASDADPVLVWGEISSQYLWDEETRESLAADDIDFCAHASDIPQALNCSSGDAERRVVSALEPGATATVAASTDLFLGFEFGAEPWTMRLSRPLAALTAPIEFRRTVLLTLALGIWLVVLASNVMLRHRLDPVARLEEATRRVAEGDFTATVAVATNDEFEDLGVSFNTMAQRLRDQFALLGIIHDVDRQALVGGGDGQIALAGLRRLPELMPVEDALMLVRVGSEGSEAESYRINATGGVEHQRIELAAAGFAELSGHPEHRLVERDALHPSLAAALGPMPGSSRLILPLADRGGCFGALVLSGRYSSAAPSELEVRRARRIADQVALALANTRLVERLNVLSWGTLETLARSIDAVSPWTAGHSERVTRVGLAIGRQLGLPPGELDRLHRGGLLHDVGKIGVSPAILDKPGKLDEAEFAAIRAHPVIGVRILEPIQAYGDVISIVRHHHERFDGTGYPDRLAGERIPYLARVLSVADVYDALVSHRPYREGWQHEKAVAYIAERASIEFDPGVVAAFLALVASPVWPLETARGEAPREMALAAV